MALSSELITQLAKAAKPVENRPTEATVYGNVVNNGGGLFVQIDGSEEPTPALSAVKVTPGERVLVRIGNHSAVILGNVSAPAVRAADVDEAVTESEAAIFDHLEANYATFGYLEAEYASIAYLEANYASIEHLEANYASIAHLEANYASIEHLEANYADIEELHAGYAEIDLANITTAAITNLSAKYANIDSALIGDAAIEKLLAETGMISDLAISEGHVTGTLVGVEIIGDSITAGTIMAERLMLQGEDGLYYQMNVVNGGIVPGQGVSKEDLTSKIHGSVIVAHSVTANEIYVDDLSAFNATIGGFEITNDSIHSFAKSSINNTTRGIYQGRDGQFAIGDATNYIKFYEDQNGTYKLDISASNIRFNITGQDAGEAIEGAQNSVNNLLKYINFNGDSAITIKTPNGDTTLTIDNDKGIIFEKDGVVMGSWDGKYFYTGDMYVRVEEQARFGNFAFIPRSDGSLSFLKVGA